MWPLCRQGEYDSDTVSGIAPAGDKWVCAETKKGTLSTKSSATSPYTYTLDFTGIIDVIAGDIAYVYYVSGGGNELYLMRAAPVVNVRVATSTSETSYVWGYTETNSIAVNIKSASGGRCTFYSGRDGYFSGYLYAKGRNVQLSVGDKLESNSSAGTAVVPVLNASLSFVTDTVTGKAPPNSGLEVTVFHFTEPGSPWGTWSYGRYVRSDASGSYTASFAGLVDLVRGDYARVTYYSPAGYRVAVSAYTTSPVINVVYQRRELESGTRQVIVWNASGGLNTLQVGLSWDTSAHLDNDMYRWSSWATGPGDTAMTFVPPVPGAIYYRAFAWVDGKRLVLEERTVPVRPGAISPTPLPTTTVPPSPKPPSTTPATTTPATTTPAMP